MNILTIRPPLLLPLAFAIVTLALAPSGFAAGNSNPLLAPPPSVKMEPGRGLAANLPTPPGPQSHPMAAPLLGPLATSNNATNAQQVFPPETWLAQAIVTSTVGDRASIMVPLSLNEAQAVNSSFAQTRGPGGMVVSSSQTAYAPGVVPGPQGRSPNQDAAGSGSRQASQPQVAVQQTLQEIIYVRTGVPFFFKGEKFSVEISGREVMIWRPVKQSVAKDGRDIIYVGSVSSTEMVRRAIVGAYAPSDPAVLSRIVPVYGASTSGAPAASGVPGSPGVSGAPK